MSVKAKSTSMQFDPETLAAEDTIGAGGKWSA
jgi:hypothetical protein